MYRARIAIAIAATVPLEAALERTGSAQYAAPPPAPPSASGPVDTSYSPTDPTTPAATHPQPPDLRVWRLVDPTEADWHARDPNRPRGWLRVDTDGHGTSGYVGGSFRISDGWAFAPFAHVSGTVAEPNLAVTWAAGPLWLMPALGTSLDFGATRAVSVDPQLFLALDLKVLYIEAWTQYFWASAYHPSATDMFASRFMVLLSVGSTVGLGGEWDPTLTTNNGPTTVVSSIGGVRTNVRIGDHDTVGLFVGRQFIARARVWADGIGGRFEYVHQW